MTYDDPCDELSDRLTEALLLDVRYTRLTPQQRRYVNVNVVYGSMSPLRNGEYMTLCRALLIKQMAKFAQSHYSQYFGRALRKLELNSVYPTVPVAEPRFYVADQAAAVTECGTEYLRDLISNPAIVIEPKPMRAKHDNPISPRTWTLD